jgi:hypothetical protein
MLLRFRFGAAQHVKCLLDDLLDLRIGQSRIAFDERPRTTLPGPVVDQFLHACVDASRPFQGRFVDAEHCVQAGRRTRFRRLGRAPRSQRAALGGKPALLRGNGRSLGGRRGAARPGQRPERKQQRNQGKREFG